MAAGDPPKPGEQQALFDPDTIRSMPAGNLVRTPGGRTMTREAFDAEAALERTLDKSPLAIPPELDT